MATDSLGQLTVDLVANTGSFEKGMDRAQRSLKAATKEAAYQGNQLEKLVGQIDPVTGSLNRLDKQQEQLNSHFKAGRLPIEDYRQFSKVLDAQKAAAETAGTGLGKLDRQFAANGQTLKQYQNNLRGVPAQFTDIFTSLQGGQAPFTVLIQQGGQLKDMFGGLGPATKALGGYVLGLVNPLTIAGAAAVALAVAYKQGSDESSAYIAALSSTNNFAGTSADGLATLAERVSDVTGTVGAASEVLAQLAGSGKIAVGSFDMIAVAALKTQSATGQAASEIVANFVKIADDPLKAIIKLNEGMNFLSETVYSQIKAFTDAGNSQAAAAAANAAYASAVSESADKIKENLGYVESSWNFVKEAAKGAWDAMAGIGRDTTLDEGIKKAQELVDTLAAAKKNALPGTPSNAIREEEAAAHLTSLLIEKQEKLRRESSARTSAQQKSDVLDAAIYVDKVHADGFSKEEQRLKARETYELKIAKLRAGVSSGKVQADDPRLDAERIAKDLDGIDEKYKEKKAARAKAYIEDAGTKELDQAKQQYAVLQQQSQQIDDQTGKTKTLGAAQQELIKWEQELSDLKNKGTLTAAQKSLLSTADQITAQKTLNAELEKDTASRIASAKQAAQMAEFQQSVADNVARYQQGLDNQVAGIGLGSEGRHRLQVDLSLQQDYAQQLERLRRDKIGGKIDQDTYDKQTQILKSALEDQLQATRDNYSRMDAARADWTNGANAALQDYAFEAADIAGQTYDLVSDGLSGIEDAFVDLATTGKFSFRDLADSIIADLARIIAKTLIVQPLIAALFGGGGAGGGGASLGGLVGSIFSGSSSGSSSSSGWGGMVGLGKDLYSVWSAVTGVGADVVAGWASGGLTGAVTGGINYYAGLLSTATSTFSTGVTSLATALGLQTAATTASTAAAGTGYALGGSLVSGTAGSATYAAGTGAGSGVLASMGAMWPLAVVLGMYQSGKLYDAGVRPDAGKVRESAGGTALGNIAMTPGVLQAGFLEGVDKVLGKVVGGKWAAILSGSTFHQMVWTAVGSKLFGTGYKTKDVGIQLGVDDGVFDASQYVKQKKKKGLISGSNKTRYLSNELDEGTEDALGSAYNAKILGAMGMFSILSIKLSDSVLDGLDMAATRISTKDKTPEAIQSEIEAWFVSLGDSAVSAINKATTAGLDGYTFSGLSTFINNLVQVNAGFDLLNLKMLGMTVAGGKLAESLLIGIGGMEQFNTNGQKYYEAFFSDTEKADDTLAAVTKQFKEMGYTLPDTRDGFRALVESLDTTTEAGAAAALTLIKYSDVAAAKYAIVEQRATAAAEAQAALAATNANYYSLFTTDAEKANDKLSDITAQFAAMGLALPTTNEDFKNMVYAAGQAGASGKKAFDFLMGSAGNASDAIAILAQQSATLRTNAIAGATAAFGTLQRSITAQQKDAATAYNDTNTALTAMSTTASTLVSDLTSVGSSLSSALKNLRGDSDAAVKMLRAQAHATLQSALATARAGGSLAGFTGLDDALDTASNMDPELYASLDDFEREQGRTANVIAELNEINGDQLTTAQKSLAAVQVQIDQAKLAYETQLGQFDQELAFAQAQLDVLNGVDTSILSVAAAVNAMNAAVVAALRTNTATSGPGSASAATPADNATMVNTAYKDMLGRDADAAGLAAWVGALQGGASYQQVVEGIRASAAANGQLLPGHALGTNSWDGTPALVGEHGPEIVMANNISSATIYPAQRSRSILNAGSAESAGADTDTAKFRDRIVKILNEVSRNVGWLDVWNSDGMPATRT
ncbi:phage tail tape measure protein [Pseudomonas sp. G.S.17]|uniref:phage tail tape measure protein n=1 Tax=Pseudomonas sp. G.S.17 TaxID=3137451 RepID=UPI00311C994F